MNYPGEQQCASRYEGEGLAWVTEKCPGEEGKPRKDEQDAGFAATNHALTLQGRTGEVQLGQGARPTVTERPPA